MRQSINFFLYLLFTAVLTSFTNEVSYSERFINWAGNWHPILLHFPIALIVTTGICEILYFIFRRPFYDHAAQFMIIAAAGFIIPTVLTGFAYGLGMQYQGWMEDYFWWHRFFALFSALLAIACAILKGFKTLGCRISYYVCLLIVFFTVNITGYFGGSLTFGRADLFPPLPERVLQMRM
ncbi:MAG: hypothetical protein JSR46_11315 [Verrucomicrobia bacterium]|nr:hypothetical protein [Verrucomicrobiota bacterium]